MYKDGGFIILGIVDIAFQKCCLFSFVVAMLLLTISGYTGDEFLNGFSPVLQIAKIVFNQIRFF